jgi:Galactose oxidase, central domain
LRPLCKASLEEGSWFRAGLEQTKNMGDKTMKTFHSLVAGFRPASSILARRIAFPLLFLGAGLALVQPCMSAPFQFEPTGSLTTARCGHTATLLPNGKVLVAGGNTNGTTLATAELYDPATGTWTATGSLATARWLHTATLLRNGKVLVAGGADTNFNAFASAELYDPANGTWTATGSLGTGTGCSHGDVAAQWQGARRRRC